MKNSRAEKGISTEERKDGDKRCLYSQEAFIGERGRPDEFLC